MPFAIDEEKMTGLKMMDLAAPPLKSIPMQEFPKMVYDHKRSRPGRLHEHVVNTPQGPYDVTDHIEPKLVTKTVNNAEELKAALKAGFSEKVPNLYEVTEELPAE